MLDVHPPHEPTHTWTDFFIHIATIVVGLLIAVGLEQIVDWAHHRHEARHARELLREEMAQNLKLVKGTEYSVTMHKEYLFADLPVVDRMRAHHLEPGDRIVLFHPYNSLATSAWDTAARSQTLVLLPYDEVRRDEKIYKIQQEYTDAIAEGTRLLQLTNTMRYHSAADRFDNARSVRNQSIEAMLGQFGEARARQAFVENAQDSAALAKYTPTQIDRLEQAIQESIYFDERLLNRCSWLEREYKLALE